MRLSLFKKAQKILAEGRIKVKGEGFFDIVPSKFKPDEELLPEEYYSVAFTYENYVLKHTCTCKYMSSTNPTNLCAHKLACIMWIGQNI